MNILQARREWKVIIISILFISTLWISCSKSNSNTNIYKPDLKTLADLSKEESLLFDLLNTNKQIMDTTTREEIFTKAKTQFDIAKDGYDYIYETANNEKAQETYSFEDNKSLLSLCDTINIRRQKFNKYSFIYTQIEKEGIDVLINFNILKEYLGLSDTKKFDLYASFDIIDNNILKYEQIRKAYKSLTNNSNKDNIAYYSENINRYQIIFICANLEDLLTIRSFVEKSNDLYTNRKNKNYIDANKSKLEYLTKEYTQIGNRKELCSIYLPRETSKLYTLEKFASEL